MHLKRMTRAVMLLVCFSSFVVAGCGGDGKADIEKEKRADDDDDDDGDEPRRSKRDDDDPEEAPAAANPPPPAPVPAAPGAVVPPPTPIPAVAPAPQPAAIPVAAPAPDPLAGGFYATVPQTTVQVPVPRGWRKSQHGHYMMIQAPKDEALFLFTTVSSQGEFAGRKQQLVKLAGVREMHQTGQHDGYIGPDRLQTRIQEFEGDFHGTPGHIQLFFLDQGRGVSTIVLGFVVSQKEVTDPFVLKQFEAIFANVRRS